MKMTNIVLLSQLSKGSGNLHTIERIRTYLCEANYICSLLSPDEFDTGDDFSQYLTSHEIKLVIGLHAFRAGKLLQDSNTPHIIIIGGTDVNEMYRDANKFQVMTKSIMSARKVVVFSHFLLQRTKELWPELSTEKVVIIKQAVMTLDSSRFSLYNYIRHNHSDLYTDDLIVLICAGSIRPVKNPLYLVKVMSEFHQRKSNVVYVICGPIADKEYGANFKRIIESLPGIIYIPGLPLADTHAAIKQSFAFINSSNSEGMALAVLEAMMLKVPVIVRDIDGNKEIVKHQDTGLHFSTSEECISQVELLLGDKGIKEKIILSASNYINQEHSVKLEKTLYIEVVESCLKTINCNL